MKEEDSTVERKKIEYCGYLIPSQDKEAVLNQMKAYYDDAGYHLVAFFDYEPVGLSKMFRKCRRETLKSIMNRFRAFKPKEARWIFRLITKVPYFRNTLLSIAGCRHLTNSGNVL